MNAWKDRILRVDGNSRSRFRTLKRERELPSTLKIRSFQAFIVSDRLWFDFPSGARYDTGDAIFIGGRAFYEKRLFGYRPGLRWPAFSHDAHLGPSFFRGRVRFEP